MNNIWITFLQNILKIPGAKIDRKEFLRKTFSNLSEKDLEICINEKPSKVMPLQRINAIASSIINSHLTKVTTLSALSGIPGGLTMLATIPADMANYYYHVVALGQKLGYLYGYPDMLDQNGNLTEDGELILTSFIGAMNNVKVANEMIKQIAVELGKRTSGETAARVAGNLLSKQIVAQSVEAIAKKLGTQVSANTASRGVSKAIPIISGLICGAITYHTFKKQAKRLQETLQEASSSNVGLVRNI